MKRIIYIVLFSILYLSVGIVSTIHAVQLFNLANTYILAIILAITFEVGQAVVLFSILTSPKTHSKIMPWALMGILTLVQILGNVFSSYKYLILHSYDSLRFFKEPIFVWTDLPDNITTVILTYIIGAILPIVALCMTAMLNSFLENEDAKVEHNQLDNPNVQEVDNDNSQDIHEDITDEIPNEFPVETPSTPQPMQSHFINL